PAGGGLARVPVRALYAPARSCAALRSGAAGPVGRRGPRRVRGRGAGACDRARPGGRRRPGTGARGRRDITRTMTGRNTSTERSRASRASLEPNRVDTSERVIPIERAGLVRTGGTSSPELGRRIAQLAA